MTDRWHRTADLVGLSGMGGHRTIRLHGVRRGWVCREVAWGKRTRLEWLETSLPEPVQATLRQARGEDGAPADRAVPGPVQEGGRTDSERSRPCQAGSGPRSSSPVSDTAATAVADARLEILQAFEAWRAVDGRAVVPALRQWARMYSASGAGVSDATRERIATVSWGSLKRWREAFNAEGFAALIPRKGGRRGSLASHPKMTALAESKIRGRPLHITAKQIQRALRADFPGEAIPGIASIRRWMRRYREENASDLSAISDPDGHRSRLTPAFGSAGRDATGLNSIWELDSTTVDVMCEDGRRYALVAAIDIWSRRARVTVTPQSRASAIATLIRRCLLDWGVPQLIVTDEGADYTSKHLRRVVADLGVAHQVLPPFRPDLKPFVERFIGTISRDLFSELPGFVGHNVAEGQAIRSRRSFAARRGEDDVKLYECSLTAEALQCRIDAWCDTIYEREPHGGLDDETPFARAASWTGEIRRIEERGLDILLAPPPAGASTRVVTKKGLPVGGGLYIAAEIGDRVGERLQVRLDPADYGRVYLFEDTDETAFVCVAEDPLRTGIDREAVAHEAKRRAAEADKAARKRTRELERATRSSTAIDRVLAAAKTEADTVVALPPAGTPHTTSALEAAAEAEEAATAIESRPAARSDGRKRLLAAMKSFHRGVHNDA